MKFQIYGWEHIIINAPSSWHLFFEKKPKKKDSGYFGLRDQKEKKVELSWAPLPTKKKPPQIKNVLKDYFKTMTSSNKHVKLRTEGKTKVKDHQAEYFYWHLDNEDIEGYITSWICVETQRIFICTSQFSKRERSNFYPLLSKITSEIDCHPDDAYSLWSAPNLNIFSPLRELKLIKRQFLIGLTFLQLGNQDMDLFAYRLGLANQKVKSFEEIVDWFQNYYKSNLPGIPSRYNPKEFVKIKLKGSKKIDIDVWKSIETSEKKLPLKSRKSAYWTYIWLNDEKNDIYCLILNLKGETSTKLKTMNEKIVKRAILAN